MRIEKVCDSIEEFLGEFDFFRFLMKISDYIAYFASFMVVINQLTYLGEFANAVWTYIFITSVILNFASKKYISLQILFISLGTAQFYSFVKRLFLFPVHTFSWRDFLGIFVCGLLTFLFAELYKAQNKNSKA